MRKVLDHEIINQILLSDNLPLIIEFELNVLTTHENATNCLDQLQKNGYKCFHLQYKYAQFDVIAIEENSVLIT